MFDSSTCVGDGFPACLLYMTLTSMIDQSPLRLYM
jgi:hypothetical protein